MVYVRVEQVSLADAPAEIVAQSVLHDVRLTEPHRIDLEVPQPDPRQRYAVRVHVDTTGSGEVGAGDYVTTRSYPVLTHDQPSQVSVQLARVQ